MKKDFPLKRGDLVKILVDADDDEREVVRVGKAGFLIRNRYAVLLWGDRGKTWRSDKLDRLE
jgi:hypothetical protein